MLSNIINQIQKERARDRVISTQTGTNQRHDHITNIPGHRKVSKNSFFSMVPLVKASTFTEKSPTPTPVAEPEPEPTPTPVAAEPEPEPTLVAAEPEPTPVAAEPEPTPTPANDVIPKGMSRAAIRKKQREEELAKKRQEKEAAAAAATAPEPTLIEIESTVSQ